MDLLELTLPTAAENLALDEALLDEAEAGIREREVLRLWELPRPAVVLGRSSRLAEEVDAKSCASQGIEIVRRSSGGAAILSGPGCLMYSLLLSCRDRPALRHVDQAHAFVLGRLADALSRRFVDASPSGTSDLAIGGRKFSGNSLRLKRDWCLYHGTLLYAFDLCRIGSVLKTPPRQPAYRQGRSHDEFLINLPLEPRVVTEAAREAFGAFQAVSGWPWEAVARLVRERYGREEWTRQR